LKFTVSESRNGTRNPASRPDKAADAGRLPEKMATNLSKKYLRAEAFSGQAREIFFLR
jgi:hypothetical protein